MKGKDHRKLKDNAFLLVVAFLCNKYGLLTKCEIKMAGYWPSPFLRVYGPRRTRGPKPRKKRTRPISSHLDRTNVVNKGFIIWLSGKCFMLDTAGSPERARWLHLAHLGSQSHRAIWFILPARGASHIIIVVSVTLEVLIIPWSPLQNFLWALYRCVLGEFRAVVPQLFSPPARGDSFETLKTAY